MSLYNKYEELGCYEWETNYLLSLDFASLPNGIKILLEQLGFNKVSHQPSLPLHVNGTSVKIPNYGISEITISLDPKAQIQDENCLNLEEVYPQIKNYLEAKVKRNGNIKAVKKFFVGCPGVDVYVRSGYIEVLYGKEWIEIDYNSDIIELDQLHWIKAKGAKFAHEETLKRQAILNDVVVPLFNLIPPSFTEIFLCKYRKNHHREF